MSITKLRGIRTTLELSQLNLAAKSGVSLGTISKIEAATKHTEISGVGVGKLISIAKTMGVSALDLYPKLGEAPEDTI
ncbi:MAG: hypothetical protein CME70_18370 [Halobacteriovorax sp.]|nr:hypothetical protein [Halobacteriovorax sp.]